MAKCSCEDARGRDWAEDAESRAYPVADVNDDVDVREEEAEDEDDMGDDGEDPAAASRDDSNNPVALESSSDNKNFDDVASKPVGITFSNTFRAVLEKWTHTQDVQFAK